MPHHTIHHGACARCRAAPVHLPRSPPPPPSTYVVPCRRVFDPSTSFDTPARGNRTTTTHHPHTHTTTRFGREREVSRFRSPPPSCPPRTLFRPPPPRNKKTLHTPSLSPSFPLFGYRLPLVAPRASFLFGFLLLRFIRPGDPARRPRARLCGTPSPTTLPPALFCTPSTPPHPPPTVRPTAEPVFFLAVSLFTFEEWCSLCFSYFSPAVCVFPNLPALLDSVFINSLLPLLRLLPPFFFLLWAFCRAWFRGGGGGMGWSGGDC